MILKLPTEDLYKRKDRVLDHLLVLLLVAFTGFPFFYSVANFILVGLIIAITISVVRGPRLEPEFVLVVLVFMFVDLIHVLSGDISFRTFVGTPIRLTLAYLVVILVGYRFCIIYIKLMFWLTLISFVFYGLSFIPGVIDYIVKYITPFFINPFYDNKTAFYPIAPNILIYTFDPSLLKSFRNSGPFWEPGALAVFLIIALVFTVFVKKSIRNKETVIFTIGILTTLSTAGYVVLFGFYAMYFLSSREIRFKWLYLIVILFVSYYLYISLDFLSQKVLVDINLIGDTTSRFGSGMADLKTFQSSPLWGTGRSVQGDRFTIEMHRNNGLMNLLASYGIFIFILYFTLYYTSFRSVGRFFGKPNFAFYSMVIIIITGFSQGIFMRPFFYSILFLGLAYKTYEPVQSIRRNTDV